MSSIPHDQSESFSAWLDAFVAETPDSAVISSPDEEVHSLRSTAERFHNMSDTWNQQALTTSRSDTTWEDLMATNPHALPTRTTAPARIATRHWDTVNRFVSVALVVALLVGIGAGAWHLANRESGSPGTPPTGVPGLAQSGDATPDQQMAPVASPTATTPIEELPGIQSAVLRMYAPQNAPSSLPDLFNISVGVYGFDSAENAAVSYDLIVQNQTAEFTLHAELNGTTLVTETLDGPGELANLVRIVEDRESNYQVQQYLFALHENYVFAVMTVTGGPTALNEDAVDSSTTAAADLATTLVENGQPSPDAARFYADGTSTGGDWGFMPPAGDPLLLGLVPFNDQQLFPPDPSVEEASASYPPEAADLTGIVGAVYRDYASAGLVETDGIYATGATPMTEEFVSTERLRLVAVLVYELESPKDAAVAYDRLTTGFVGSLTQMIPGGQQRLVSEDVPDVGDQATQARLTVTSEGGDSISQMTFQYVVIQRDEYVFVISSDGRLGPVKELPATATEASDTILELAIQIAAEGEPSPDEASYAEDGTSTGGLWGFMPETGDPLLMGLVPLWDQLLYPVARP